MKLFEEFKEYENLWEAYEPDETDKILAETEDFELEYDGFEDDWYQDHFDSRYGHSQSYGTNHYSSYAYDVDAVSMYETIRDEILPKYASKYEHITEVKEWNRLNKIWQESTDETEAAACEAVDVYLAANLGEFVDTFIDEITEYYAEDARVWALNHLDPDYD